MTTQISWPPVLGNIEMLGEIRDSKSMSFPWEMFSESGDLKLIL